MRAKNLLFALEVFFVFMILTAYLWYSAVKVDRQKHQHTIGLTSAQLKYNIHAFITEKISVLRQVRNFWLISQRVTHEEFLGLSQSIVSEVPGFQAIEFVDASGQAVWTDPQLVDRSGSYFDQHSQALRRETLERAIRDQQVAVTPTLSFARGGKAFAVVVPIHRKGVYEGSIFGVFQIDTMFMLLLDSAVRQNYDCAVFDGQDLIYQSRQTSGGEWVSFPHASEDVSIGDRQWRLTVWPKEPTQYGGVLGVSVLVLGFSLSSLLGALIYLLASRSEQAELDGMLLEVSQALSTSVDVNSVFRISGDACLRLTGADRYYVFIWDSESRTFRFRWSSPQGEAMQVPFMDCQLSYQQSPIARQIVEQKSSFMVSDATQGEESDVSLARRFNIRSVLVSPLLYRGELLGAMSLDRRGKKHRFSMKQRKIVEGIAYQAASALAFLQLQGQQHRQAKLIASKNQELDSLLFTVSHDLRNPLVVLAGLTALLAEDLGEHMSECSRHYLERIRSNIDQMEAWVKDVVDLSRIGRLESSLEVIDVPALLDGVLLNLKEQAGDSRLHLVNQNKILRVCYNRGGLEHIFTNLIDNAIKFSSYQEMARVTIGSDEENADYLFWVQDNGIGIDRGHHQDIFDIFHRLQDLKEVSGTGVGLTIVKRVLETFGGRVWLESKKGKGSTFFFSVPKLPSG